MSDFYLNYKIPTSIMGTVDLLFETPGLYDGPSDRPFKGQGHITCFNKAALSDKTQEAPAILGWKPGMSLLKCLPLST